jgi:hypothetical protein
MAKASVHDLISYCHNDAGPLRIEPALFEPRTCGPRANRRKSTQLTSGPVCASNLFMPLRRIALFR